MRRQPINFDSILQEKNEMDINQFLLIDIHLYFDIPIILFSSFYLFLLIELT